MNEIIEASIGTLYVFGAGEPKDFTSLEALRTGVVSRYPGCPAALRKNKGLDCSGHAQGALVLAGRLPSTDVDRNAASLAAMSTKVDLSQLQMFDLLFYGGVNVTHVAVYYERGMVFTMSGGTSSTFGDDPLACGQIRPIRYRKDLKFVGRIG